MLGCGGFNSEAKPYPKGNQGDRTNTSAIEIYMS